MVNIKKTRALTNKKIIFLIVIFLMLTASVLLILEKKGVTNFYQKTENTRVNDATTTSTSQTAQESFNEGEYREPGNSLLENEGDAEIVDLNGEINGSTNIKDPITSKTGEVAVYTPTKGATLRNGDIISGKSTLQKVSYRLIDSSTGMIATGELSVVNGSFSAKINFSTSAPQGRLDIFAVREDLSEYSNIEIPVSFAQ